VDQAPPFDEAEQQLAEFLATQSWPTNVRWVFRDQLFWSGYRLCVCKIPVDWNRLRARSHYEFGRARGCGVSLNALCTVESVTLVYVWVPDDKQEAQYAHLGTNVLKITVPTNRRVGKEIGSGIVWSLQRGWNRWLGTPQSLIDEVPSLAKLEHPKQRLGGD
jgi:hypothetical protein